MAACRSCEAPVVWARTEPKGDKPPKAMPLDATADGQPLVVPGGNLVIIARDDDRRETPVVRYVATGQGQYVSHFATCPDAASFRRK